VHAVVHTGGAIPSILFGIPGTGPCVATIVDGHPMTKSGRGGEAMGAQLAASAVGGIIGAGVLAVLIPVLKPIAMAFGSAEILMLIVFGLTFIVVISRKSIVKGFTAALFGLLLSIIGLDPHTGVGRFTFDQLWLWDGIDIVILVLGIFAFAEMMELGARGGSARIAEGDVPMPWSQLWKGTVAVFREWWLSLRTAVIGAFVGIVPGLGGDTATWICYGHAAQTCKDSDHFGQGDIRGVIGVETANNSKEGGALLTTVVFGIPGSSGMAILLGAFLILGIVPGPEMIREHLDIVWGMVWVLVISNIIGAATLYPLCGYMGKLAYLRGSLLIPPIIIAAAVGSFLTRNYWQDLCVVVLLGFVGYAMKRWDYPRPPLILSFILGRLAEDYLHKSLTAWGVGFLKRPVVAVLLFMVILSLLYSIWDAYQQAKKKQKEMIRGGIFPALVLLILFTGSLCMSLGWSPIARLFPFSIAALGVGFSIVLVISEIRRREAWGKKGNHAAGDEPSVDTKAERGIMLWVLALLGMVLVFGFWVSIVLFTPLFMVQFGHERWKTVAIFTICIWLAIYLVFDTGIQTSLFGGILGLSW
jgi:TctA family transporter